MLTLNDLKITDKEKEIIVEVVRIIDFYKHFIRGGPIGGWWSFTGPCSIVERMLCFDEIEPVLLMRDNKLSVDFSNETVEPESLSRLTDNIKCIANVVNESVLLHDNIMGKLHTLALIPTGSITVDKLKIHMRYRKYIAALEIHLSEIKINGNHQKYSRKWAETYI